MGEPLPGEVRAAALDALYAARATGKTVDQATEDVVRWSLSACGALDRLLQEIDALVRSEIAIELRRLSDALIAETNPFALWKALVDRAAQLEMSAADPEGGQS